MLGSAGMLWMVALGVWGLAPLETVEAPLAPVLSVEAPQDTHRVTAYFPFGLSKELTLDERRMRWRGRAVVAHGVPEGSYPVALVMENRDGGKVVRREVVDVNHAARPFEAAFTQDTVPAGGAAELTVDTVEPATQVKAHCPALGWRNVKLGPPTQGSQVDWGVLQTVPAGTPPGSYVVTLTLSDVDGHTLTRELTLHVVRGRPS
jgi:hypothetical protein